MLYKDGDWNTLCLPFDVIVGSDVMEGATAMTLNGSTSNFNSESSVLTLNFDEVGGTLAAGNQSNSVMRKPRGLSRQRI